MVLWAARPVQVDEVTPGMQHGFRTSLKAVTRRGRKAKKGKKSTNGKRCSKVKGKKPSKKLRKMRSFRKGACGRSAGMLDTAADESEVDKDAAAHDPATAEGNGKKAKRAARKEDTAKAKPKAKAKPAAKPKAKAAAKAKAKAKAKSCAKPKAAAKAKKAGAKSKHGRRGSADKKAAKEPAAKRRAAEAEDGDEDVSPKQEKLFEGTRQWRYVVHKNQVLGCVSCRYIFHGCRACRSETFRGRNAATERLEQQKHLNTA